MQSIPGQVVATGSVAPIPTGPMRPSVGTGGAGGGGSSSVQIRIPPSTFPPQLDMVPQLPSLTGETVTGPRPNLPPASIRGSGMRYNRGRVDGTDANTPGTIQILVMRERRNTPNEDMTEQQLVFVRKTPRLKKDVRSDNLNLNQAPTKGPYKAKTLSALNQYLFRYKDLEENQRGYEIMSRWSFLGVIDKSVPPDAQSRQREAFIQMTVIVKNRARAFNYWHAAKPMRGDTSTASVFMVLRRFRTTEAPQMNRFSSIDGSEVMYLALREKAQDYERNMRNRKRIGGVDEDETGPVLKKTKVDGDDDKGATDSKHSVPFVATYTPSAAELLTMAGAFKTKLGPGPLVNIERTSRNYTLDEDRRRVPALRNESHYCWQFMARVMADGLTPPAHEYDGLAEDDPWMGGYAYIGRLRAVHHNGTKFDRDINQFSHPRDDETFMRRAAGLPQCDLDVLT